MPAGQAARDVVITPPLRGSRSIVMTRTSVGLISPIAPVASGVAARVSIRRSSPYRLASATTTLLSGMRRKSKSRPRLSLIRRTGASSIGARVIGPTSMAAPGAGDAASCGDEEPASSSVEIVVVAGLVVGPEAEGLVYGHLLERLAAHAARRRHAGRGHRHLTAVPAPRDRRRRAERIARPDLGAPGLIGHEPDTRVLLPVLDLLRPRRVGADGDVEGAVGDRRAFEPALLPHLGAEQLPHARRKAEHWEHPGARQQRAQFLFRVGWVCDRLIDGIGQKAADPSLDPAGAIGPATRERRHHRDDGRHDGRGLKPRKDACTVCRPLVHAPESAVDAVRGPAGRVRKCEECLPEALRRHDALDDTVATQVKVGRGRDRRR